MVSAISASPPAPLGPPQRYDAQAPRALRAAGALGRELDAQDPRVIHDAAALLTSELFFAPLLAEMRKLPFGRAIGYGGRGEEVFGEQLDQRIADAVARADRSLTPMITQKLEASARKRQAAEPDKPQRADVQPEST